MKLRYEVTKGHPMSGRACTVAELDGTELLAHYTGYFSHRRREWKLYPMRSYTCRPMRRLTLEESDVKIAQHADLMPRKKHLQNIDEPDTPARAEQIKLV